MLALSTFDGRSASIRLVRAVRTPATDACDAGIDLAVAEEPSLAEVRRGAARALPGA